MQSETEILEKAIVKIGHLLALGFGEAGGTIIKQNVTGTGDLEPLMPGTKTHAIFGFCIIDKFVETTEALQNDIFSYVNKIAEITHSMVDRYGGSTNKNIGEAFLMVWKFYNKDEIILMSETEYDNSKICKENLIIADMSLFSMLKIIAKINKYRHIIEYNDNERLKEVVDPNFRVRMGFGLHHGWAIEGAIGSFFKVDASYLSPNVNMASRL
jgi:class 3 adenylate cyclase